MATDPTVQTHHHTTLDSLRGISALVVALAHGMAIFIEPLLPGVDLNVFLVTAAQASVMVFFALSGFLIGKSIAGNIARGGEFDLGAYARARALRIYPPLVFAVLFTMLLVWLARIGLTQALVPRAFTSTFEQAFGSLMLMNGFLSPTLSINGPLWSLSIEVWYYVIAGLCFTRRPVLVLAAMALFASGAFFSRYFVAYSPVWFAGLLLSFVHPRLAHKRAAAIVVLAAGALLAAAAWALRQYAWSKADESIVLFNVCFGLAFALGLVLLVNGSRLRLRFLSGTAAYSYTLYLIHFPLLVVAYGAMRKFAGAGTATSIASFAATMTACVVLAWTAAHFFEDRRRILHWLRPWPRTARATTPVQVADAG